MALLKPETEDFALDVCWRDARDSEAVALLCDGQPTVLLWVSPFPPALAGCNSTAPLWSLHFISCRRARLTVALLVSDPYWLVHDARHTQLLARGATVALEFDWTSHEAWSLVPATQPACPVVHIPWQVPKACLQPGHDAGTWRWQDLEHDAWWLIGSWCVTLTAFNTGLVADVWGKNWGTAWQTMFMVVSSPVRRHLALGSYLWASAFSLVAAWLIAMALFRTRLTRDTTAQGMFFSGLFGLSLAMDWGVPQPVHHVACG